MAFSVWGYFKFSEMNILTSFDEYMQAFLTCGFFETVEYRSYSVTTFQVGLTYFVMTA